MIPRRTPPREDSVDAWLMTYADMITLLLAFFIIFVSTSEPKQEKLDAATQGMRDYFAGFNLDSPFDGAMREVQGIVASRNAERFISAEKTRRGLAIELSSLSLFAPGSADMLASRLGTLEQLADVLNEEKLSKANVAVEGYTGEEGGAGWELAALRASRVAALLQSRGVAAKRLRVVSFGDTKPLVPERDSQGIIPENQAVNSRIVIRAEMP